MGLTFVSFHVRITATLKGGGRMAKKSMDWRRRGTVSFEDTFIPAPEEATDGHIAWLTATDVVAGSGLAFLSPDEISILAEAEESAE